MHTVLVFSVSTTISSTAFSVLLISSCTLVIHRSRGRGRGRGRCRELKLPAREQDAHAPTRRTAHGPSSTVPPPPFARPLPRPLRRNRIHPSAALRFPACRRRRRRVCHRPHLPLPRSFTTHILPSHPSSPPPPPARSPSPALPFPRHPSPVTAPTGYPARNDCTHHHFRTTPTGSSRRACIHIASDAAAHHAWLTCGRAAARAPRRR